MCTSVRQPFSRISGRLYCRWCRHGVSDMEAARYLYSGVFWIPNIGPTFARRSCYSASRPIRHSCTSTRAVRCRACDLATVSCHGRRVTCKRFYSAAQPHSAECTPDFLAVFSCYAFSFLDVHRHGIVHDAAPNSNKKRPMLIEVHDRLPELPKRGSHNEGSPPTVAPVNRSKIFLPLGSRMR